MKLLILGCSFSAGHYTWAQPGIANFEPDEFGNEKLHQDYCWYDELGINYTAYAHPGGGLMAYCQCLSKIDLSGYSHIIIQETFEPRIVIQQELLYETTLRQSVYLWRIENIFHNKLGGLHNQSSKLADRYEFTWQDTMNSWFYEMNEKKPGWDMLANACATYLDTLVERTGLPTYAYSFTGIKYPYKYIKYLDVQPATEKLFYDKDIHFIHFNRKGNHILGQMIKKGLDNVL
tara:strand:+ start:2585 stop:3283 length:699 start_codon:yes stop_codon:yes gene_type:complete